MMALSQEKTYTIEDIYKLPEGTRKSCIFLTERLETILLKKVVYAKYIQLHLRYSSTKTL